MIRKLSISGVIGNTGRVERRSPIWVGTLVMVVVSIGCSPTVPVPPVAQRLVVAVTQFGQAGSQPSTILQALDPQTLADVEGMAPLDVGSCAVGPIMVRGGHRGVVIENGTTYPGSACPDGSQLRLRVLDVATWTWERDFELEAPADRTLELAWNPGTPALLWNADGSRLFVFTASRVRGWAIGMHNADEVRQLWIIDTLGSGRPTPVSMEVAAWRVNLAPAGQAVYVLGYQTRGPSRWGDLDPGSTVLLILDPATGAIRSRIPLPGVKVATLRGDSWYDAGVAVAPNGRYYYVAHPDEPLVEVVDVFAPGYERLERLVTTENGSTKDATRSNWLTVSPDGGRLYSRRASGFPSPAHRLGLLHVIDTRTWAAAPFDPTAASVQFSPTGEWIYAVDVPRTPSGPPLQMPVPGASLRVIHGASGQQSVIAPGQTIFSVVPDPINRLVYAVVRREPEAHPWQPPPLAFEPAIPAVDLIAYEVGTWRESARREWPSPIWLPRSSAP
jgi:DNA-binding beta-propeller fold protein YncE